MVESSQERSQLTNRELALKILRAKLYQMELDKQLSQQSAQRKLQVMCEATLFSNMVAALSI